MNEHFAGHDYSRYRVRLYLCVILSVSEGSHGILRAKALRMTGCAIKKQARYLVPDFLYTLSMGFFGLKPSE